MNIDGIMNIDGVSVDRRDSCLCLCGILAELGVISMEAFKLLRIYFMFSDSQISKEIISRAIRETV